MSTPPDDVGDMANLLKSLLALLGRVVDNEIDAGTTPQLQEVKTSIQQAAADIEENVIQCKPAEKPEPPPRKLVVASSTASRRPYIKQGAKKAAAAPPPLKRKQEEEKEEEKERAASDSDDDESSSDSVATKTKASPKKPVKRPRANTARAKSAPEPAPVAVVDEPEEPHILVEMAKVSKAERIRQDQAAKCVTGRLKYQEGWKFTLGAGSTVKLGSSTVWHPCVCCRSRLGAAEYKKKYIECKAVHHSSIYFDDESAGKEVWWGTNDLSSVQVLGVHHVLLRSLGLWIPVCLDCGHEMKEAALLPLDNKFSTDFCRCCLLEPPSQGDLRLFTCAFSRKNNLAPVPLCKRCLELPAMTQICAIMKADLTECALSSSSSDIPTKDPISSLVAAVVVVPDQDPPETAVTYIRCDECAFKERATADEKDWTKCHVNGCVARLCQACSESGVLKQISAMQTDDTSKWRCEAHQDN